MTEQHRQATSRRILRWWQVVGVLVAIAIAATACSSGTEDAAVSPTVEPVTPIATQAPEPTAATVPTAEPTATPAPTAVPTPAPTPTPIPCGNVDTGPTFADHCLTVAAAPSAACALAEPTYFTDSGQLSEWPFDGQEQVVSTGVTYRLDEDRRTEFGNEIAQVFHRDFSGTGDGVTVGYLAATDLQAGQCPGTAGPADDFDSLPCHSFPIQSTIGSADSDALFIGAPPIIYEQPGCMRLVFEFRSSPNTALSLLPAQIAPTLGVASDQHQTEISLPAGFEPGANEATPDVTDTTVVFEDVKVDGARRLQILHAPSDVRLRVLDGPARLVIDLVPATTNEQPRMPIIGTTAILKDAIDPTGAGFTVGDTITVRGWLRPRQDAVAYIRSLAVQESTDQLVSYYSGVVPFLALGAPLSAPDGAALPSAWTPFAVNVDTQNWFGASHAILIGDDGPDGFRGSGQIVQITEADGATHELYGDVPSEVLVDSEPTSWVQQG